MARTPAEVSLGGGVWGPVRRGGRGGARPAPPGGRGAPPGGREIVMFCLVFGGGGDTVVPYSVGFKARMVKRLAAPNAPSATALAREVRVPQPTLSAWLREARTLPAMGKDPNEKADEVPPRSPRSWTAEEKYAVGIDAA